jgi:hypothetical protein
LQHARQLAGLQRRWNVNNPFSEISSGVVPVVEVDKHRAAEDQDIYGMLVQSSVGNGAKLLACALVAQDREVLIHKIDFHYQALSTILRGVHIFTPLQNYNPFNVNSAAYFAWLQGPANVNDVGKLGRSFGIGGAGNAHQVVVVNGVPVTTFGPFYQYEYHSVFVLGAGFNNEKPNRVLWSHQDPPFRLKPFSMCCVQEIWAGAAGDLLDVNFFYSERVPQGDVG